ncbi:MAG TPA: AAA family ATPase [Gemmatimonadaceae bacterium]|nr:AAA family ATPase [Gemmatimonadaceae bacterium]
MIGDFLAPEGDALKRFTRDLTADARGGRLEPVRCRDAEVERVIDILLRHGKNNPTLVGPAGVGKTAIAEGLAQRIAEGRVPLVLRNVRLLSLDHVGLLAGTTYRGQYEQRISALVSETTAARNVILFIDELHNLIGQGTALGAAMDAANMLKPALVRGDFRVIGATTNDEYEKWILGDPALERRFQKVVVRELGADDALVILQARKERLERHHNVLISDEALRSSISLTDEFVSDRMRPDKAIDALDEACAHMQAVAEYPPRVEELVKRRVSLLRRESAKKDAPSDRRNARPAQGEQDERGESEGREERSPQDGFGALERFGAELEALFMGPPPKRPAPNATAAAEPPAPTSAPPTAPLAGSLSEIEGELNRLLMELGIVVRGHDIARVVSLMSGKSVAWTD